MRRFSIFFRIRKCTDSYKMNRRLSRARRDEKGSSEMGEGTTARLSLKKVVNSSAPSITGMGRGTTFVVIQ